MPLRTLLLALSLLLTALPLYSHTTSSEDKGGSIRIVITPETTSEELDGYKEDMAEQGYELTIKPIFEDGKLQSIRGSVDFGSGGSGNFCTGTNFTAVILQKKWLGGMSIEVKR